MALFHLSISVKHISETACTVTGLGNCKVKWSAALINITNYTVKISAAKNGLREDFEMTGEFSARVNRLIYQTQIIAEMTWQS